MVYRRKVLLLMLLPVLLYANNGTSMSLSGQVAVLNAKNVVAEESPGYRRIDLSKLRSFDFTGKLPVVLEFNVVNKQHSLYENSGDYMNPDNQSDMFGNCGGRIYNIDELTGDYKRDTLGNVISFLGINERPQYGKTTNYAFYLDSAYLDRGTAWIKPQYMIAVDPFIPEEKEHCDPVTGEMRYLNGKYVIGRYMYNTSMYAKIVADSVQNPDGSWVFADKYYDKDKGEGIKISETDSASGYLYTRRNFSKVQPVDDYKNRDPNGEVYKHNKNWERLAFSWAIHKGDSLYVLKGAGLEPMYKGADNDPYQLWLTLSKEYGEEGMYIDFDKLISENIVEGSAYQEAYYPMGERTVYPEMRTYYDYKHVSALSPDKTIGLQAIIALDDNTHKDWVFSFRFVERDVDDFVIESETTDRNTAYGPMIRPGYGGWVKYQNEVPVITRSDRNDLMAGSAVFNVTESSNPVDNDFIDANADVIVTGEKGYVLILNAAGKNVIIRNILGQVVATKIVSSDYESIASPTGFVVVVVGGGKGIKTIVR